MTVETVSPGHVFQERQDGKAAAIIDVRTPVEFAAVHAEGATLIPLNTLDPKTVMSARNGAADEPLYVICKSGARAAKAVERFHAAGFANVASIEGGTDAWVQAGLPVVRGATSVISLERQVRIAAGALVVLGALLGWQFHPGFHGISAFVGVGLVFAGVSDWCGMGLLLAKMPWNNLKDGSAPGGKSACKR